MMTPYECYMMFSALKMHYGNTSYDYFKYNGKTKATYISFQKRPDRYFYSKLTQIPDLQDFLIPIIINNPKVWIKSVFDDSNQKLASDWVKRKEARSYFFEQDLNQIEDLKDSVRIKNVNEFPILFKSYINNSIGIDTIIILDQYINFFEYWNKIYIDNILYRDIMIVLNKTKKFIAYDNKKILQTIRKNIANL